MPSSNGSSYLLRGTRAPRTVSSFLQSMTLLKLQKLIQTLSHSQHNLSLILYGVSIIANLAHLLALLRSLSRSGCHLPSFFKILTPKSIFTITMPRWFFRRKSKDGEPNLRKIKREAVSSFVVGFNNAVDRMAIALLPQARFKNLEFNINAPRPEATRPVALAMSEPVIYSDSSSHSSDSTDSEFDGFYPPPMDGQDFAPPPEIMEQITFTEEPPAPEFPDNNNIHRYFEDLPANTNDPSFAGGVYSIRQEQEPYPPSTADPLAPALLADLRSRGRNDGVCLIVKAVQKPKHLECTHLLVEDTEGQWQILHIFDLPFTKHAEDRLSAGQMMIIKEPYFYTSYDGMTAIRVDHATDILYVMQDHPLIPQSWHRNDAHGVGTVPRLLKWDGEIRMKWKKYHQAIDHLTLGIKLSEELEGVESLPTSEITTLYLKQIRQLRVGAYYYAGYYDLALADANDILAAAAKFDEKAAWIKANCLLRLRQYDEAKQLILTIMQGRSRYKFKECSRLLLQIRTNTAQIQGEYNMSTLIEDCKESGEFVHSADYVTGIRVKRSQVHGYGIFTTKDVKVGELVFAAKAFATVSGNENCALDIRDPHGNFSKRKYGHKLVAKMVEKMYCEPRSSPLICKIHSDSIFTGTLRDEHGMVLVDKYGTPSSLLSDMMLINGSSFYIHDIVEENAVQHDNLPEPISETCAIVDPSLFPDSTSAPTTPGSPAENGFRDPKLRSHASFWIPASFINHSCVPNAHRTIIGDMIFITAAAEIPRGSEVFLNYLGDKYEPRNDRKKYIESTLGFTCVCTRCTFEAEHKDYFHERQKYPDTIKDLVTGQLTRHLPSQLAGVRGCLQALRLQRFDHPDNDFPQFDLVYGLMAEEHLRLQVEQNDGLKSLGITTISSGEMQAYANMRLALNIITALGGEYEFTNDDVMITRIGFVCGWLLEAYILATVASARFYGGAFWSLRGTAGAVYRALRGEDVTYEVMLWERVVQAVGELTESDMLAMEGMYAMLREWEMDKTELAGEVKD
ncbi:hypothetical protein ABW21_db0200306 [Orbilia brochopaga]|nr:hypothetical protein ABW21_db0200306 [Drechslerella brochopaga]